ncbi:MAG: hypothetical protein KAH24_00030, partial [Holophagae bacterium]|nr:hypothetical protein [Holophagae bacterium]
MFVQAAQHAGLLLGLIFAISSSEISDEAWREMKSQAVHRNREVIQNNDGCDALYYPRGLVATKENLIQQRMINAVGTKVGTYSYCPVSSGFGHLTIETTVGDQLLIDPPHAPNRRNVTGELLGQGTDPLKIAEAFCRENDLELFASLRCNDTHDTSHTESNPYFLF